MLNNRFSNIKLYQLIIPVIAGLCIHLRMPRTVLTALGLLAVTGMRISELVALDNDDVDLAYGQLTIRDAKFGKSRWLPLACQHCPSLQHKRVTPHVLRHSAAMELLQNGVDCAVIALWLGHESMDTTQIYLHASLELKERALEKTTPINGQSRPLPAR